MNIVNVDMEKKHPLIDTVHDICLRKINIKKKFKLNINSYIQYGIII